MSTKPTPTVPPGRPEGASAPEIPFVDLRIEHHQIQTDLEHRFRRLFQTLKFVHGDEVSEFEKSFADRCGVAHAVGVANGTDALLLTLRTFDIGRGHEVILPVNTFVATAEAVVQAGATPVFAEIIPETGLIDPDDLERCVTPRTRGLIPVHLYGQPAPMDEVLEVAERFDLAVIEDAAQAHGAQLDGRTAGSMGHAACFSFYPSKNLGAYGDAGAVVTDDPCVAQRVRALANHGNLPDTPNALVGSNSRLDSMQAAVLIAKLPYLERWNEQRREAASWYTHRLAGVGRVQPLESKPTAHHVYHLYVARIGSGLRDALREYLSSHGISTGIHYPRPLHLLPCFRDLGHREGDFPAAEQTAREILSLPMYPGLGRDDVHRVVETIEAFLQRVAP